MFKCHNLIIHQIYSIRTNQVCFQIKIIQVNFKVNLKIKVNNLVLSFLLTAIIKKIHYKVISLLYLIKITKKIHF